MLCSESPDHTLMHDETNLKAQGNLSLQVHCDWLDNRYEEVTLQFELFIIE